MRSVHFIKYGINDDTVCLWMVVMDGDWRLEAG